MNYRKCLACFLSVLIVAGSSGSVMAEETADNSNYENTESSLNQEDNTHAALFDTNLNDLYDAMFQSMEKGQDISLSDAFNQLSGYTVSQQSPFSTSDMSLSSQIDFGSVNLQFVAMSEQMEQMYNSSDLSGKSLNSVKLFNSTYGDILKQASLETPEIPSSFSAEKMIAQDTKNVNKAYSNLTNSSDFSKVKNKLSIGTAFDMASKGVNIPDLKSNTELSEMISGDVSSAKNKISSEYKTQESAVKTNVQKLFDESNLGKGSSSNSRNSGNGGNTSLTGGGNNAAGLNKSDYEGGHQSELGTSSKYELITPKYNRGGVR